MKCPETVLAAAPQEFFTPRRLLIVALVGALHVMIVYALVTGLASRWVREVSPVLNAEVLPPEKKAPPAPPPALVQKDLLSPALPTIEVPIIKIAHSAPSPITVVQGPRRPSPPVVTAPVVAPPAPVALAPPTPARAVAGTHTTPPYPDASRRLNEQGTVQLAIAIGPDGRVGPVTVTQSSGSDRLDRAAVAWVTEHWRYQAATRDGKPVTATVRAAVVFNIKDAH